LRSARARYDRALGALEGSTDAPEEPGIHLVYCRQPPILSGGDARPGLDRRHAKKFDQTLGCRNFELAYRSSASISACMRSLYASDQ
jgi:hypothetical protein